jgi:hypothetical protein
MVKFKGKSKGAEVGDATAVQIVIKPDALKNKKGFRYKIDPGSSLTEDQEKQHEQLNEIMGSYISNPMAIETLLNAGGETIDFPNLFKQWLITGGTRDWQSILKSMPTQTPQGQQGASQQGAPAQQAQTPNVTLSGQMDPTATASAEQQAGLTPGQPQQQQQAPQPAVAAPVVPQHNDPDIQAAQHAILAAHGVHQARTAGLLK